MFSVFSVAEIPVATELDKTGFRVKPGMTIKVMLPSNPVPKELFAAEAAPPAISGTQKLMNDVF